jgi:methyltransferase family protein
VRSGALSVLAAKKTDQIYGYDFSSRMLEFARENAKAYGAKNAKFAQKAFEDDWSDVPECDVVFASRCLEVDDLKAALSKLLSKTKKSLYITFKVGGSFVDEDVLGAIGRKVEQKPDFVYLLNILFQMGYLPSLSYIKAKCHAGPETSAQELIQKTRWGLGGELSETEEAQLAEYFNSGKYKPRQEFMHWAFVRVDKANRA